MKEKVKKELIEYTYDYSDGCCTNYCTITKVIVVEMECQNQNTETIIYHI